LFSNLYILKCQGVTTANMALSLLIEEVITVTYIMHTDQLDHPEESD